jgi:hypothetical protein
MAATITSPDCRRVLRSQPVIDQGAPEALGAASSDNGRARPTPPSRKVTLYGPKFAVGANAVGVNAGADDDSAAQAGALAQSAQSAKQPQKPLDLLMILRAQYSRVPAYE